MASSRPTGAPVTLVLAGLVAITPLTVDMPLPALPTIARAFAVPAASGQLVVTAFLLGFALAQLVLGPLSDRLGRRPVLLGGLGLYTVASLGCALAPSLESLAIGRFLQGIGACAGPVAARAAVRDIHEGARAARTLAVITSVQSLAPLLAPNVGAGLLACCGWRAAFVLFVGYGAGLAAVVAAVLPETNLERALAATAPRQLATNYATLITDRRFLRHALTAALGGVGLFAFLSGGPFVLIERGGLSPRGFGLAFAGVMLGQISGALLASRLSVRWGIDPTIRLGLCAYVAGGLTMGALGWAGTEHVAAVLVPMGIFMLGNGLTMPTAIAGAIMPFARMAGAASALAGFLQMMVGATVGFTLGRLHDGTPRPLTTLVAIAGVAAALAFLLIRPRSPHRVQHGA